MVTLSLLQRLWRTTPQRLQAKKQEFQTYLTDVADRSAFCSTHQFVQHGNTSVLLHSIAVAYYSYHIAWHLRLRCREKELVRGALLHDYFLYDWHIPKNGHTFHAFTHGRDACRNAQKEFRLSKIERDVIRKHMFPLTPVPPLCREGVMVCLVDKGCSLYETFKRDAYPMLRREILPILGLAEHNGQYETGR